jgi:flagellar M-ring protein FliF
MKPAQVVLLDTQGQLLHQGDEWGGADPSSVGDQYAAQRAMETDVESRLQQMLDRVLGPGHSAAQVSLQLDWSHSDTTSETYNPNGQQSQIKTDQEVHEVQTPGSPIGGVPGVTSNVPTYQQSTPVVGQGTGNERTESNKTFEVSRVVQKTQNAPGTVKRLSVSIAVDSSVVDAATVDNLTQMAKGAVGFDASRGDALTVVPVPLKQLQVSAKDQAITASSQQARTWEMARLGALVAGPVLAIIILGLLLLGRRSPRKTRPLRVTTVPEVAAPAAASGTVSVDTGSRIQSPQRELVREQIQAVAERDPALVASILKEWVREDRRNRQ